MSINGPKLCTRCHDTVEDGRSEICYSCYLCARVPWWYPDSEEYEYDRVWGQSNATKRPKTGVRLLDDSRTPLSQAPIPKGLRPRR